MSWYESGQYLFWEEVARSEKSGAWSCNGEREFYLLFFSLFSLGQTRGLRLGEGQERRHV